MRRKRVILWLAALLLVASFTAGQLRLSVSRYDCPVAGLPDDFEGYRIVQLSDLHGASFGKENRRLVDRVRRENPDIIVLTGDFIEDAGDLPVTGRLLPELTKIAPCYFVSGNHEWASGGMEALRAQLAVAGVRYLENEFESIDREGGAILLCGVEDPNSWADLVKPDAVVREAALRYPGTPIILLGHRNYWIREYPQLPVELILCGHGHGGIVRLPGLGGLVGTDRLLFPEHTEGVACSGSYHMVISRGLGRIYGMPRIFNSPEIVVAVLQKEA